MPTNLDARFYVELIKELQSELSQTELSASIERAKKICDILYSEFSSDEPKLPQNFTCINCKKEFLEEQVVRCSRKDPITDIVHYWSECGVCWKIRKEPCQTNISTSIG